MGKRKYQGSWDSNKRFKEKYNELTCGCTGVLVTHDRGKERFCRNDTFKIFNYFADNFYAKDKIEETVAEVAVKKEESEDEEEIDIKAALEKEIEGLKEQVKSTQQRFLGLKSGCNNMIFIKCNGLRPSEFVQELIEKVSSNSSDGIPVTRSVLRLHPADVSCKAHLVDIKEQVESYFPDAFSALHDKLKDREDFVKEFNILYKGRNCDHLGMHVVIEAVCDSAEVVVPDWKYNCRSNNITVLVNVIKNVCVISVVYDYARHKKFNLREIFTANAQTAIENTENKTT